MTRWSKAVMLVLAVSIALIACQRETNIPRSADQVPRLTPQQVNELFGQGKAVLLVDARSRAAYEQAHIPNAISLPLQEIEAGDDSLPQDVKIVLYCT